MATTLLYMSEQKNKIFRQYLIQSIKEKLIEDLESYPNFENWFIEKVVPMVGENNQREVIISLTEIGTNKIEVTGIAVLNKTFNESKICLLKVNELYRGMGIGISLFRKSFEYLETQKPLITVSEDNLYYFKDIFSKLKFDNTSIIDNYYVNGKKEYVFNGHT